MSTADKLQQLRLERQKSDLAHRLHQVQAQLEQSEADKYSLAEESGAKIKQALSLLDNARKEIDKLRQEKETLTAEVTELRRKNQELEENNTPSCPPAAAAEPANGGHPNGGTVVPETITEEETEKPEVTRRGSGVRLLGRKGSATEVKSGVIRRNRNSRQEDERPMSMAERMSMFESKKSGGRNFGGGNSISPAANPNRKSWRDAPPQVKLTDESSDDKSTDKTPSPRASPRSNLRPNRVSANRHSMPPNAFSTKDVQAQATKAPVMAGKAKLNRAVGGMMAAMEAEKKVKGIDQPKPKSGFLGVVNQAAPKNPVKRAHSMAAPGSAASKKQALLHWCQRMTEGKAHVDIRNFSSSWNNGMAFCALFHHFIPDQIPYDTLDPSNREYNFALAFKEGEKAGVTALLDVEDMVEMKNPEWMSVMTYISLIYNHFNGIRVGGPRLPPMPNQN